MTVLGNMVTRVTAGDTGTQIHPLKLQILVIGFGNRVTRVTIGNTGT